MEIILIANEKGGTAKSATALNMGACLKALGYRVLIADTDPSGNLSAAALPGFPSHVLYDIFSGSCAVTDAIYETPCGDLIPTIKDLTPADNSKKSFVIRNRKNLGELFAGLNGEPGAEQYLSILLRESNLEHYYDIVIIDSAPAANLLITNAVVAADSVIVPIEPNSASIDGFLMFLESIRETRQKYHTNIQVDGIVFTKFSDKWKTRRKQIDGILAMANEQNIYIYNSKFRTCSSIETSMNECRPILDYIKYPDNGASDSINFTLEFLQKRGLEPKQSLPGIVKDEFGKWIYRKNGTPIYDCRFTDDGAQIVTRKFHHSMTEKEGFQEAIGTNLFFHLEQLEASLMQKDIAYAISKE